MIVLGAVMLVLAALLTAGTVFTNSTPAQAQIFGVSLAHVSVGGLFLTGVITGVVGMLGLSLMLGGGARKRHKKVQQKREVRAVRGQAETLEQENARLRDELAGSRPQQPGLGDRGRTL